MEMIDDDGKEHLYSVIYLMSIWWTIANINSLMLIIRNNST